jgi:hypothetical protein
LGESPASEFYVAMWQVHSAICPVEILIVLVPSLKAATVQNTLSPPASADVQNASYMPLFCAVHLQGQLYRRTIIKAIGVGEHCRQHTYAIYSLQ